MGFILLDVRLVRSNPELVRKNLEKRQNPEKLELLDQVTGFDKEWRSLKQENDSLKNKRNVLAKEINDLMKSKKDAKSKIDEAKSFLEKIKSNDLRIVELEEKIKFGLMRLPNVLDDSVPIGKDSLENVVVKTWGKPKKFDFELKHHGEMAVAIDGADFERAVKISGTGFYILKGHLALLDIALQRFALDDLMKKGFTLIEPPFLLARKPYEGVTDLNDFENVMYKIEGDDLYLIATSEHPMGAMHMNEIFESKDLPIKYCGISACFRREIGKHGLDERGLFRVHQFNKIEQFVFCKPEDSPKFHEEIRQNSEWLLQQLEIPYQVVAVCTGDIGTVAAKKYDIEGWSPREQKYIELMSCSNCTTYQAIRLNIKYRVSNDEKDYVHTLNNTEIATARVIRLILENYQTKDGTVLVPKVLQPYMNGLKEMKAVKK